VLRAGPARRWVPRLERHTIRITRDDLEGALRGVAGLRSHAVRHAARVACSATVHCSSASAPWTLASARATAAGHVVANGSPGASRCGELLAALLGGCHGSAGCQLVRMSCLTVAHGVAQGF